MQRKISELKYSIKHKTFQISPEEAEMDLLDKDFKLTILKMLKKLDKILSKKLKKSK